MTTQPAPALIRLPVAFYTDHAELFALKVRPADPVALPMSAGAAALALALAAEDGPATLAELAEDCDTVDSRATSADVRAAFARGAF